MLGFQGAGAAIADLGDVGNLPPMPRVFPDYPAPVVRNFGTECELLLMRWGTPHRCGPAGRQ
jgi:hypothetical protein